MLMQAGVNSESSAPMNNIKTVLLQIQVTVELFLFICSLFKVDNNSKYSKCKKIVVYT